MTDPATALLFLREDELRQGLELLFFAQRDLAQATEALLTEAGLGPAHRRVLYFVGRQPDTPVGEVGRILQVTKQSLTRLLQTLESQGLIHQKPGSNDRRQRLISLTEAGRNLDRALWAIERPRLAQAYRAAGAQAVDGCRQVLLGLIDQPADRSRFDRTEAGGRVR